ncbi:MAG: 3-methyladenine DNA glycosylase [Rhizobiales bacterium]|nr:3-methyladenine DNA glycosylase [Hyphomicrobiales bacterium]
MPVSELAALGDDRWLSQITRCVFQAGFSWKVIETKWPGFEEAFEGFQPRRWKMMSDDDLDRLVKDKAIVRNPQKILSVRGNAQFLCDLADEHGSAAAFFAGWPVSDQIGLMDLMKKRGSRLGGTTGQVLLRRMGKDGFIMSGDVVKALIREGIVDKPPTSKKALATVQDAFNAWHDETGRPYTHLSRILAMSVG